jgi:hypothetical protein
VAGLSLFLVLVVGGAGLVIWLTQRDSTYHAPLGGSTPAAASPAEAASVLHRLEVAVRSGDAASAARLGASATSGRTLAGVARNARALRVDRFSMRYVDQAGGVAADGSWTAYAHVSWLLTAFDRRPESLEVRVRFAPRGGGVAIARIGGGDRRSPLWLAGPVQVRRSAHTLVEVQGDRAEADRVARLARAAVPQVRRVLRAWSGPLVVEVPATEQRLDEALHARPGQYDGIAAVTTTADGSRSPAAPVHVFVNPQAFLPLGPHGAQVVVTHEATHVATGAASSTSPTWLVEGFADYVALRAQHLPLRASAARIIALVHRQGAPSHLPGPQEFRPGSPHLEARYESAWLACRLLADDGGPRALVAFYRGVDAGHPLATELRRHFGLDLATLTRQWRTFLSHLPA